MARLSRPSSPNSLRGHPRTHADAAGRERLWNGNQRPVTAPVPYPSNEGKGVVFTVPEEASPTSVIWPLQSRRLPPAERLHRDYMAKRHFFAFHDMGHFEVTLEAVLGVATMQANKVFAFVPTEELLLHGRTPSASSSPASALRRRPITPSRPNSAARMSRPPSATRVSFEASSSSSSRPSSRPSSASRGSPGSAGHRRVSTSAASHLQTATKLRRYEGESLYRQWILGTATWLFTGPSGASPANSQDEEEIIVKAWPTGEDGTIPLQDYLHRCRFEIEAAGLAEAAERLARCMQDPLGGALAASTSRFELEQCRLVLEDMITAEEQLDFSLSTKGVGVDGLPKAVILAALDALGAMSCTTAEERWEALKERASSIDEAFYGPDYVEIANLMIQLGKVLGVTGQSARQRDVLLRAFPIQKAFYGANTMENARLLVLLAGAYGALGDAQKQRTLVLRAQEIMEASQQGGRDDELVGLAMRCKGLAEGELGDPFSCCLLLEQALQHLESTLGEDHVEVALTKISLADSYGTLGEYRKQLEVAQQCLHTLEASFYLKHFLCARPMMSVAAAQLGLGEHPRKVMPVLKTAIAILQNFYGDTHVAVVPGLVELGRLYGELGDWSEAEACLKNALEIAKAIFGPGHPKVSQIMIHMANAYCNMGSPQKTKEIIEFALECLERTYGPEHYSVGHGLLCLANAEGALGNFTRQNELLETRTLSIFEDFYGREHIEVALVLQSLAAAHSAMGDGPRQKALLDRAWDIQKLHYQRLHHKMANALIGLGDVCANLNDLKKSEHLLREALKLLEDFFGSGHPQVAIAQRQLAHTLGLLGDEASLKHMLELLDAALLTQASFFGNQHVEVARTRLVLDEAYAIKGFTQDRKDLLEGVLGTYQSFYGKDHDLVAAVAERLTQVTNEVGESDDKSETFDNVVQLNTNGVRAALPGQPGCVA
eukprot:TRINITY_DN39548_c0_g1_i1.p1 TRINITY_DN39548_c0_g1~~TRINITY_DN39548_c0_g1_i1.p1  ORF type:complete len:946 (-),score=219.80 TRINITY_DN39548_c0_g1_i1:289-3126(-)